MEQVESAAVQEARDGAYAALDLLKAGALAEEQQREAAATARCGQEARAKFQQLAEQAQQKVEHWPRPL